MEKKFETSDLQRFREAGIEVRIDRSRVHMHHKFCVVDGLVSVSGSFNWTSPSADGDNRENIVICRRPKLVARFKRRFEKLWAAFEEGPGETMVPLETEAPGHDGACRLLFFPDLDDVNFEILVKTIQNVEETLDVALFILTVRELKDAMIDAKLRGVRIRVILDDKNEKIHDGDHIEHLRSAGIEVRFDNSHYHMHHKFAVVDRSTVVTGSFNWTRAAEDNNEEDCLVLPGQPDLAASYTGEFERLWAEFA